MTLRRNLKLTKIKICGLRREKDVEMVNRYLPDYIGFIFAKSKRRISLEEGQILSRKLDSRIKKVGVFVNEDIEKVLEIAEEVKLDIIQLHGEEEIDYINSIGKKYKIWKAIRVENENDIKIIKKYKDNVDKVLLDSFHKNEYGGTGLNFNWNMIKNIEMEKIVLAGGINCDNILEAIKITQAKAIDVSSGVETDGFKDSKKIEDIILKVRNFNNGK